MSLPVAIAVFAVAALTIGLAGTRLAGYADELADRTGLGEAFVGAVFLAAATSLPGITASVTAAAQGHASLAVSNAVGGMAAQTAFLVVADLFWRKTNLEHAAASVPNLLQGALLIALLSGVLLAANGPEWTVWSVHPMTPLLVVGYVCGVVLVRRAAAAPQWLPHDSGTTVADEPSQQGEGAVGGLWARFAVAGGVTAAGGWAIAQAGVSIAGHTGLSETVVGGLFTAISTSIPELVTAIAAVRRGALTLAVADIVGGNTFDVLFTGAADIAYREGSVYHAIDPRDELLTVVTIAMTAVLVMGLLTREKHGPGNIGFEGVLIVVIYVAGFALALTM